MKTRAILTSIWLVSFFAAIVVVESYFYRTNADGIPFLLPPDRPPVYKALALLYGINIGAILVAWFTKPFPKLKSMNRSTTLKRFALVLTVGYNLLLLYLLSQGHFPRSEPISKILSDVKMISGLLVFLVAPVNTYYFGVKTE